MTAMRRVSSAVRVTCVLALALALSPAASAASSAPASAASAQGIGASTPADAAAAPSSAAAVEETPSPTQPADCPVPVPSGAGNRVECGVLTVPERRGDGADPERTIELPYAVISSTSRTPQPDPIVFPTPGGPGGSSFDALEHFLHEADWATDDRDVILLEQRGARHATPSLDCPQLDVERFIVDGERLTGAADSAQQRRSLRACQVSLTGEGIDLSAYTSSASAADLADLRAALEYDAWNLYGVSYGSRLAMTVMRDAPDGLRSVILDGPYPPNINSYEQRASGFSGAVDHLLERCSADLHCSERYPHLELSLRSVFNRAAGDPLEVTAAGPDGEPVTVTLDEATLARGLLDGLYSVSSVQVLPFVIDQLAQGNAEAALPLAQVGLDTEDRLAEGLHWSVECAEEVPFNDPAVVDEADAADEYASKLNRGLTVFDICGLWDVPALGEAENAVVSSDIPTLIVTGGFDPVTPQPWAEAAAEGLTNANVVHVPTMAHGTLWETWIDDCPASIARAFLAQPDTGGSSACVERMERVMFLTTADVDPTAAIFVLSRDVLDAPGIAAKAVPLGLGVLLAAGLLYGLVVSIKPSLRTSPDIPAGTPLALVLSSAFLLAYAAALLIVLVTADPLLLAFGLPASIWPVLLLPWAGMATTALLVVLLVIAWVKDDGELSHRIALSVFALSAIGALVWLLLRGLLML